MLQPTRVLYWAEGPTDRAVARSLIEVSGGQPGPDYSARRGSASGKDRLDSKVPAYNAAASREPFLILRDFDQDAECPGSLARQVLPKPAKYMCLRIVVPEVEAWLMADAEAFANWLGVGSQRIPRDLELMSSGKETLLALARRSTKATIRDDLLPRRGSGRREGPLYAARLIEFVEMHWDIDRASKTGRAPSLSKAILRLKQVLAA